MVGKNHLRAIRDEEIAFHLNAGGAQRSDLLQKRQRIEHHAIADYAGAFGPENAAGHKLQNKFLAIDDDSVSGVVAAGIAGYHFKCLCEDVDNFAFALVAPLGPDDYRGSASSQFVLRLECARLRGRPGVCTQVAPRIDSSRKLMECPSALAVYV